MVCCWGLILVASLSYPLLVESKALSSLEGNGPMAEDCSVPTPPTPPPGTGDMEGNVSHTFLTEAIFMLRSSAVAGCDEDTTVATTEDDETGRTFVTEP